MSAPHLTASEPGAFACEYNTDMDTARTVKVASEREREHFRRLGQWEAENHEMRLREHLALPAGRRLEISLRIARTMLPMNRWGRKSDEPTLLHERARQLGLYRR